MTSLPSPQPAPPRPEADEETLAQLLRESIEIVERFLRQDLRVDVATGSYARTYRGQLAILRALMSMRDPVLAPDLDPLAPLGHAFRSVEGELGLEPGGGVGVLEELADLGLLERQLHAHVQVCPGCRHFHVQYRETCIGCDSMDIEIERLIHHFHCAYVGLEPEFQQGLDLVCPRCRRKLYQLGQDFEWPHDTYVCHDCHRIFEDPSLRALCVCCAKEFPARDAEQVRLYSYAPTPLTVRAVELNRLTGLDVSEIMYDTKLRLATRDFLVLEVEREIHRVCRYGGAFSAAQLAFSHGGREYPVFREWRANTIRDLSLMLTNALRPLDLVARLSVSRVGLFLPETDAEGVRSVERRLVELLDGATLTTRTGQSLEPVWITQSWEGSQVTQQEVMAFFDESGETP